MDIEARETKEVPFLDTSSYGAIDRDEASAVQVDTPYFHLDLTEAVAAAEVGPLRLSPQISTPSAKDVKVPESFEA
jgi:hypothetical protein